MKTPLQDLKEFLYAYNINRGKQEILLKINKLMEKEKECLAEAANHGRNKYINDQINELIPNHDKDFGEVYYTTLYDTN